MYPLREDLGRQLNQSFRLANPSPSPATEEEVVVGGGMGWGRGERKSLTITTTIFSNLWVHSDLPVSWCKRRQTCIPSQNPSKEVLLSK